MKTDGAFLRYIPLLTGCLFVLSVSLISCVRDNVVFYYTEAGKGIDSDVVEWRRMHNEWIFKNLKWSYFWSDSIKDSTCYDFTIDPIVFFYSLKSSIDRFSFVEYNESYKPVTKAVDVNETVSLDTVYKVNGKDVGYFVYNSFETEADITDVALIFKKKRIKELIVDLRNNGGGLVKTCIYLSSIIVPERHLGSLFCTYKYNNQLSDYYNEQSGSPYRASFFKDDIITRNRNLRLNRVLFLTGERSASCSELIINCLKPYMDVVTIGETTTGKDVGMTQISDNRYRYVLYPITFRTYNAHNDSVPMTGIIPDIYVKDSLRYKIGEIDEPLLSTALEYIKNN